MARRRLSIPDPAADRGAFALPAAPAAALPRGAPISRVTGEAAAAAALQEVAGALEAARAEGRLVLRLPLEAVEADWLVRDRAGLDAEALAPLKDSLAAAGQRHPVEVADLGGGRYGLISGWRRLMALRALLAETGEARFATVLALVRRPETAGDAYVAMVEENEIRLGLSYFERARITARAVAAGVFASEKIALQRLFATASRSRRSKIGSFLTIWHGLGAHLRFGPAVPERLGLALARAMEADPGLAPRIAAQLAADPPGDAGAEQAVLAAAAGLAAAAEAEMAAGAPPAPAPVAPPSAPPLASPAAPPVITPVAPAARRAEIRPGLFLETPSGGARLVLSGPAIDAAFAARLRAWLAAEG